jgi:cytochrome c556
VTDTETPAPAEPDRLAALEEQIKKLFDLFRSGDHDGGSETEPASMSAEIRAELEKLRKAEEAARAEQERSAKVDELSAKVASIPEKRPQEYRRPTNWMGWVTEKDR